MKLARTLAISTLLAVIGSIFASPANTYSYLHQKGREMRTDDANRKPCSRTADCPKHHHCKEHRGQWTCTGCYNCTKLYRETPPDGCAEHDSECGACFPGFKDKHGKRGCQKGSNVTDTSVPEPDIPHELWSGCQRVNLAAESGISLDLWIGCVKVNATANVGNASAAVSSEGQESGSSEGQESGSSEMWKGLFIFFILVAATEAGIIIFFLKRLPNRQTPADEATVRRPDSQHLLAWMSCICLKPSKHEEERHCRESLTQGDSETAESQDQDQ